MYTGQPDDPASQPYYCIKKSERGTEGK
uniref:Uncharacterized protein n=1 Tax=Anguilla anguilla TaxID=7936 RepID=A0A0E9SKN2_ANGAN